jgi:hypothetical protein
MMDSSRFTAYLFDEFYYIKGTRYQVYLPSLDELDQEPHT